MYVQGPGIGFSLTEAFKRARKWQPGKDIVAAFKRQTGIPAQLPSTAVSDYDIDIKYKKAEEGKILGMGAGTLLLGGAALWFFLRKKRRK